MIAGLTSIRKANLNPQGRIKLTDVKCVHDFHENRIPEEFDWGADELSRYTRVVIQA